MRQDIERLPRAGQLTDSLPDFKFWVQTRFSRMWRKDTNLMSLSRLWRWIPQSVKSQIRAHAKHSMRESNGTHGTNGIHGARETHGPKRLDGAWVPWAKAGRMDRQSGRMEGQTAGRAGVWAGGGLDGRADGGSDGQTGCGCGCGWTIASPPRVFPK